jgi:hypothetical protein
MSNFKNYYFEEEEIVDLQELTIPVLNKSFYASNFFKKLFGKKSRRINPVNYEKLTREIELAGYNQLLDILSKNYLDKRKEREKIWIKDLYKGEFDAKNEKELPEIFPDIDDIEDVSIYITNKKGMIILYQLIDDENRRRYFVGMDNNGERYFIEKLGMSFNSFVTRSGSKDIFRSGSVSQGNVAQGLTYKTIDKQFYQQIIPQESVEYYGDLIERELIKVGDIWKRWSKNPTQRLAVKPKKGDIAVDNDGYPDETTQAELDKVIQPEGNLEKPVDNTEEPSNNDDTQVKSNKDSTQQDQNIQPDDDTPSNNDDTQVKSNKDSTQQDQNIQPDDDTKYGDLGIRIKDNLQRKPVKIGQSKNVKDGYAYLLKNGGKIYVYQTKRGEYKIAYDKLGKEIINNTGYAKFLKL